MRKLLPFVFVSLVSSAWLIGNAQNSGSEEAARAAYFVANFRITDTEAYAAYPPVAGPTLAPYGAEVLAVDNDSNVLEGEAANQTVVIRFPSMDAAMAWYNSPEYQEIIDLRLDNSEGFGAMIDGLPGR